MALDLMSVVFGDQVQMEENFVPKGKEKDIIIQDVGAETLIFDLVDNKAFCLNETLASVWQECDGKQSVAEIAGSVSEKLKSPVSSEVVALGLEQLRSENLLAEDSPGMTQFARLTRRELLEKVGGASLVALPAMMVLTSPTPAQAASCIEQWEPCTVGSSTCCDSATNGCVDGGQGDAYCVPCSANNQSCATTGYCCTPGYFCQGPVPECSPCTADGIACDPNYFYRCCNQNYWCHDNGAGMATCNDFCYPDGATCDPTLGAYCCNQNFWCHDDGGGNITCNGN